MWFKACPKCSGDVVLHRDTDGTYAHCVQCGFTRDVQPARLIATSSASPASIAEEGQRLSA
jgi:hypothetical protein